MASMRDIKRRKLTITNTQQITKAMKLVATAKLQKAKQRAEQTRPYFNKMHSTISSILSRSSGIKHPFLEKREGNKNAYIVITSNRGLAGGYNGNVCKLVYDKNPETTSIVAVGKKGEDSLKKKEYNIITKFHDAVEEPTFREAEQIGKKVLDLYLKKEIDHVYIAYTKFVSTLTQEAQVLKLLPLEEKDFTDSEEVEYMTYEPEPEEVLNNIIPKYISSIIFGALRESVASEHGARMTAMDSATSNASDMIDGLTLEYNRARQASITQELSEIVGGAEALK